MTAQPPSLWLLRHAEPLIAPGVCYGQLDVPADPGATLQAGIRFASIMPPNAIMRHSPLQRCEQLAQAAQAQNSFLIDDVRLKEMGFGIWEGQSWNDIGRTAVDAWSQNLYAHAPGNGESLSVMLERVRTALLDSWQHDSRLGTRDVVWVTHAGVIRCVQWLLRYGNAQPSSQDWNLPAPSFGQWQRLAWHTHTAALQALA